MNCVIANHRLFINAREKAISNGYPVDNLDYAIAQLVKLLEQCENKLPGIPIVRDQTYHVIACGEIEVCYTKSVEAKNTFILKHVEVK